jgi:hypothetical protein
MHDDQICNSLYTMLASPNGFNVSVFKADMSFHLRSLHIALKDKEKEQRDEQYLSISDIWLFESQNKTILEAAMIAILTDKYQTRSPASDLK